MSSSVYTKTGDQGTTGLYTGERVKKPLFVLKPMAPLMSFNPF